MCQTIVRIVALLMLFIEHFNVVVRPVQPRLLGENGGNIERETNYQDAYRHAPGHSIRTSQRRNVQRTRFHNGSVVAAPDPAG